MNAESPAGTQQARRLRDPAVRVGPVARAVSGEREIEALVRERHILGARLHERELDPGLEHAPAGGVELRRCDVHSNGPGAEPRETCGLECRAAPELYDIEAGDVAEDTELALRDAEDPPRELWIRPCAERIGIGVLRILRRPELAIASDVVLLRQDRRERTARARAARSPSSPSRGRCSRRARGAKSPRIVPGAESSGFVAPIIVRTTEIADSPLTASASTGPDEMKSTTEPKNGLPLCSA